VQAAETTTVADRTLGRDQKTSGNDSVACKDDLVKVVKPRKPTSVASATKRQETAEQSPL